MIRIGMRRPRDYPGGFTLLETLLALSLMTLLMVTVMATVTLYAQYRYRSLEGARYAQVLLGTIADLQNDLQACHSTGTAEPPAASRLASEETSAFASAGSSVAQERVLTFAAAQERPILFVGREDAILVLRHGANSQFGGDEVHPWAGQRQVLWLAPQTKSLRLPSAMEQQRAIEREYRVPKGLEYSSPALHRCSLPILELPSARESLPENAKPSSVIWDRNSEVQRLQFRYFDGMVWSKDWNSHLQNDRLPLAVELQLTLVCAPRQPLRVIIKMVYG